MSKLHSMPMFWSDFFGSTETMSDEARKAYLFLLGRMWLNGGTLPNDDSFLRRGSGCSVYRWPHIRDEVLQKLEQLPDGSWTQPRLLKEWEYVTEKVAKRREAGRAGGLAKAGRPIKNLRGRIDPAQQNFEETATKKQNENNEATLANATILLQQPTPTPTPTVSKKGSVCLTRADRPTLEARLREAAGWQSHPSPALFVTGPIEALIEHGADLELDVLPVIRGKAARIARPNWKYFVPAIAQARDDRIAAANIVNEPSERTFNGQRSTQAIGRKPSRAETFAVIEGALSERIAQRRGQAQGDTDDESLVDGQGGNQR